MWFFSRFWLPQVTMAAICMYHQSNDNGWSPLLAAHQLIGNNRKKRHQALTCNYWLPWHSWHLASSLSIIFYFSTTGCHGTVGTWQVFYLPFFYFQLKPVCFVFFPIQLQIIIDACCLFWPVFGCCPFQTLVKTCFFNIFNVKKLKKQENRGKI